jgi:ribosome-associated protein
MEIFEIHTEYIQLNQLLKASGWCETGAQANEAIENGAVKVNDKVELRKRNKLYKDSIVQFNKQKIKIV